MNQNTLKPTNFITIVVLLFLTIGAHAQWLQVGNKIVDTTRNVSFPSLGYGLSISISPDGTRIVGASTNSNKGAWVYSINGNDFIKEGSIIINETPKNLYVNYPDHLGIAIGQSVNIAADNKTIVIGYPLVDPEDRSGASSVYTFNGSGFVQVGNKLQGRDAPSFMTTSLAGQGKSVSISGDGKLLIVGAAGYPQGSPEPLPPNSGNIGAAWVYSFNGTSYQQLGNQLIGSGVSGAGRTTQGFSVAMSKDGKTAIVAGLADATYGTGAVWVYTFDGLTNKFVQYKSKITGLNQLGEAFFGTAISISSDGKTFVVGGPKDNTGVGAAWVYTFNGSLFVPVGQKLIPDNYVSVAPVTNFPINHGCAVAISGDGKTVVVGGNGDNGNVGAVWVYTFNGTNFVKSGEKLVGEGIGKPNFGNSVSISENGRRMAIAGYYDNSGIGAAWVYELCSAPEIASTCIDDNKVLHVVATSTFPMKYQWNKDGALLGVTTVPSFDITSSIDDNGDSKYSVVVVNSCTLTSAFSGEITQNDLVERKILGDLVVCKGDSARLLTHNLQSILWSNNSTDFSLSFLPVENTTISFTGINNQNCTVKDIATITIVGFTDVSLDLSSINNACDTLKTVTLTGGFPAGGTYRYNNLPKSVINASVAGNYFITYSFTNENGCTSSIMDTLMVIQCLETPICERVDAPCTCPGRKCPPVFTIYHGFTPNGDGVNDVWVIDTLSTSNTLTIIDKWGTEVFKADPYKNDWSGNSQDGKKLPDGIYYYFLTTNNNKERFTGAVSVMH